MSDRPEKVYCGGIEYIRADIHGARIKELEVQLKWQPIETAPKDGTPILVVSSKGFAVCAWFKIRNTGIWALSRGMTQGYVISNKPTHWQPLPNPPKESE